MAAITARGGRRTVRGRGGIYQVRGRDPSNTTFVEGHSGVVVIDTLLSAETGSAVRGDCHGGPPAKVCPAVIGGEPSRDAMIFAAIQGTDLATSALVQRQTSFSVLAKALLCIRAHSLPASLNASSDLSAVASRNRISTRMASLGVCGPVISSLWPLSRS